MTEELSREARNLIALARGGEPAASDRELEQVRRTVIAASVAAGTVLASGSAASAKTLTATLVMAGVKGIVLGAVVTVGASSVASYFASSPASPLPAVASATAHEPERTAVAPPRPLPALPESPPRAIAGDRAVFATGEEVPVGHDTGAVVSGTSAANRVNAAGPALPAPDGASPETRTGGDPADRALAFELDVLRRAQAELRAERGGRALEILDENAARLTGGQLAQERLAVEVLAACQAGQLERARRAARRFHGENAATPAAARIRASCVGDELP